MAERSASFTHLGDGNKTVKNNDAAKSLDARRNSLPHKKRRPLNFSLHVLKTPLLITLFKDINN